VKKWPTPRRLRLYLVGIWLGAALLLLVGETTLEIAKRANRKIGVEAGPNIVSAQEVQAALADLDANAADYLLRRDQGEVASQLFELRRAQAMRAVLDAAENINEAIAEKIPLLSISENLGRYLELVAQARLRHDMGQDGAALESYRAATDIMHTRILRAAAELTDINAAAMDVEYKRQSRTSTGMEILAGVVGVALLAFMVWAQLYISRKTKRMVNLPLAAATLILTAFLIFLFGRFNAANADLKLAKRDAFDSIQTLLKVRATAADAHGDLTRSLLDWSETDKRAPEQTPKVRVYKDRFAAGVKKLSSVSGFPPSVRAQAQTGKVTFDGLLAETLQNITFEGEREAAIAMADDYAQWVLAAEAVRGEGRALEVKRQDANSAFDRFDASTLRTLQINRRVFDRVLADGQAGLALAEKVDPACVIAIALLAWLGIRPRLKEYAA
jgi:hypothetical protein